MKISILIENWVRTGLTVGQKMGLSSLDRLEKSSEGQKKLDRSGTNNRFTEKARPVEKKLDRSTTRQNIIFFSGLEFQACFESLNL